MSVLEDDSVRAELLRAWLESQPGTANAHEEGGFVLIAADGTLSVERWPRGAQRWIEVPPHPGGRFAGSTIAATFHTHPNTGPQFQQEPSQTDVTAVRLDADLSHQEYEGEYVIAAGLIYRILRSGRVETVGSTNALLGTA